MDIEDVSDLFVTAVVGDDRQSTDVHYRSQTGAGSFNWRMVYPVTLPMEDPTITFTILDKDILSPNDFISEGTLSFKDMAEKAFQNDCNIKLMGNQKKSLLKKPNIGKVIKDTFKKEEKEVKTPQNARGEVVEKFECYLRNVENNDYYITKEVGKLIITMELVPIEA